MEPVQFDELTLGVPVLVSIDLNRKWDVSFKSIWNDSEIFYIQPRKGVKSFRSTAIRQEHKYNNPASSVYHIFIHTPGAKGLDLNKLAFKCYTYYRSLTNLSKWVFSIFLEN